MDVQKSCSFVLILRPHRQQRVIDFSSISHFVVYCVNFTKSSVGFPQARDLSSDGPKNDGSKNSIWSFSAKIDWLVSRYNVFTPICIWPRTLHFLMLAFNLFLERFVSSVAGRSTITMVFWKKQFPLAAWAAVVEIFRSTPPLDGIFGGHIQIMLSRVYNRFLHGSS